MDSYVIDYLKSGKAWLLVGSGPSTAMGYPSWGALAVEARSLCSIEVAGHDLTTVDSLLKVGRYPDVFKEAAALVGMPKLLEHLRHHFVPAGDGNAGRSIYKQIARWPAAVYLTTNYDHEIHKALGTVGEFSYISYSNSADHMSMLLPSTAGAILHLHGDLRSEAGLILTSDQYRDILNSTAWEYWRTKMTSIFQMNPVIVLGHSLTDAHVRHVLEAAKKGSGVVQPVCWFAPDVPHTIAREYLEKYRIRVISYDNKDGKHTNLARLVETISDFVPPRLTIHISSSVADISKSPLGSNAAAPGFFVFTKLAPYTDVDTKRVEIMLAALKAALPALSSCSPFSIRDALVAAGWPASLAVDDAFGNNIADRALSEQLLSRKDDKFLVNDVALKNVEGEQKQFQHLRARFQASLQMRIKRLFPDLDTTQIREIATDIDSALVGYFRDGGLTLASTLLAKQPILSQILPSSVLKFINQAAAKYNDHLRRQAFSTACIDSFVRPESADREYLGRVSQGFFAFHLLGVFGDAAAERLKHVKETVWLIDSSLQIPAIAANCPSHAVFREVFSKLKALGLRVFSTEALFDETREHLWFANRVITDHGPKSPDVIAAARGDLPYRKANLFLEGFINWQAAGNPADWNEYLTTISGHPSATEEEVKFAVESLPIEIVPFHDWPGFQMEHYSETDQITTEVVKNYDPAALSSNEPEELYKKARPEAEALVIVREERSGKFHMLSEVGGKSPAWFISSTSSLNKVNPALRITWQPEAFLRFLATLAPTSDQPSADKAFETLLWSLAQSGLNVLDERIITTVFGGIIDQAKLTLKEQHAAYDQVLGSKYSEPIEDILEHVPASQQPLVALQLANERAERESESRRVAQSTAESAQKEADSLKGQLKEVEQFRKKMKRKERQSEERRRKSRSGQKKKHKKK